MPVLIAAACRTPFTRIGGALADWHPVDLAAAVMNETLARAGVDAGEVDEVLVGCAEPVGAQGADLARAAVLAAGWPERVGGTVLDRAETSGTAALHAAVASIESGACERIMVLGVGSASVVPPGASALARTYGRPWGDGPATRVAEDGGLLPGPVAADRAAARAGIARSAQDAWAAASHERRASAPTTAIMAIAARPGTGAAIQRDTPVTDDDHRTIPPDSTALPPSFDAGGTVTGFSFAPGADGVAAVLLTGGHLGPGPQIVGVGRAAGHPLDPVGGVEHAVAAALQRAGCATDDISRWEIVEPTAAATLLAAERLGLDPSTVNPVGGTLGVGDTAAAEEIRLVVDAVTAAAPGALVATLAFGTGGSAATIIRCP